MLELHSLDIYALDRVEPTICITYTLKDKNKKEIDFHKMWIRKDKSECYDVLNIANLLYYEIFVNVKTPREPHIFRAYQMLYGRKLWKNYKKLTTKVNVKSTLKIAPHRNMVEFTKDYMKNYTEREMIKYTQKAKIKLKEN